MAENTSSKRDKKNAKRREKQIQKGSWPITYKWVAMGTLVAYSALGSHKVALAQVPQAPASPKNTPPQTQATLPTHFFDVPPGPLEEILPAFETASGLHVVLGNVAIGKVQSPGASGDYTNEQALARLLDGTGVSYRFAGAELVRLDLASVEQSLTVNAPPIEIDQVASAEIHRCRCWIRPNPSASFRRRSWPSRTPRRCGTRCAMWPASAWRRVKAARRATI